MYVESRRTSGRNCLTLQPTKGPGLRMNKNESNMVAVILNRFEIELLKPNMIKTLEIQRSVRIQGKVVF